MHKSVPFHTTGIDVAYVANGYVYHTQMDKAEYITEGSLQRAGQITESFNFSV